jgi:small subunit ribosomal protein S1
MTNPKLVQELAIGDAEADRITQEVLGAHGDADIQRIYDESVRDFRTDTIIKGRIVAAVGDTVLVDIGYKSEGEVPRSDFQNDEITVGQEVELFLESIEGETGMVLLSKQKADKIRGWENIITNNKEGDVLEGKVIRKIKGGLLVDVGVPVFLPASQVDLRKVEDIGEFLGRTIKVKILKIDEQRMNVIVSRRKLLEEERTAAKERLFEVLGEGDVVEGVVKNIADFGAFVDLGGVDGLLHITDISWGRIGHPSEIVKLEQKVVVKVLRIDRSQEKIALGLKQLTPNPWELALDKYPVGTKIRGRVVNLQPYGAFVEIEPGVHGLVHNSEMSWTKPVNNPGEILAVNDEIDVVVKSIDPQREEIALSYREAQVNPWDSVEEKFPVGTKIKGRVRNIAPYGVFVELEEGVDGLLHLNDLSWTKKVSHPSEVVKKGDKIDAVVLTVDRDKKRIALGRKQLFADPWETTFPQKYGVGSRFRGQVNKIVSFGAFVELEPDLEGLLHTSRMGGRVLEGEGALRVGEVIDVEVVKVDPRERKIGLALVTPEGTAAPEAPPAPKPDAPAS